MYVYMARKNLKGDKTTIMKTEILFRKNLMYSILYNFQENIDLIYTMYVQHVQHRK